MATRAHVAHYKHAVRTARPGAIVRVPTDMDPEEVRESAYAPACATQEMHPEQFLLWLAGVVDVNSEVPPTAEQWALMRENIAFQVSRVVARRLFTHGEQSPHFNKDMAAAALAALSFSSALVDRN